MDFMHFAAVPRLLTAGVSRRGALSMLGATVTGFPLVQGTETKAQKRKRRNHKGKRKNRKGSKVRVAATCPGTGVLATGTDSGDSRIAQTFVALASGPLVKARLAIISELESGGDFELRLAEVDATGAPTDEVLAVSSVASDDVPNERDDIDFVFSKPFAVKAGTEYALVLTRPGGGKFAWFGAAEARCPGGSFFSPDQSGPFSAGTSDLDHTFTAFVRS